VPTGGWFGEGAVLKHEIRKYDVMALRRSRIAFIPIETFQWLLDTSLPFTRFLLMQLNDRLGQFIAAVEYERLLDIDSRVARAGRRCSMRASIPALAPRSKSRRKRSDCSPASRVSARTRPSRCWNSRGWYAWIMV
jgi:CRP-like cAMP-binding protein